MKHLFLLAMMMVASVISLSAQRQAPDNLTVIEEQPDGELRMYNRQGRKVVENEGGGAIDTDVQSGTVSIVWGTDGDVYIQRPVSDSYYDGWVRGTLSDDGRLLTVPMGQYTAYTFSFDMGVQVVMMRYDAEQGTYVIDYDVDSVTYAIDPDGTITLLGTDHDHILGVVNRVFGSTFSYLDNEWLGYGDYATVYTPSDETLLTPPADLETTELLATTGSYDGFGWVAYEGTVRLGFDGDDVWLQGLSNLLPKAWLKGTRQGDRLTFPAGQLLGSYFNVRRYLVCSVPDENGEPVITDLVMDYQPDGRLTTYLDIFLSASPTDVTDFAAYYMGMTLAAEPDQTVVAPADLETEPYVVTYLTTDANGQTYTAQAELQGGQHADRFYLQGVAPWLPDALVVGQMADGRVSFASPQYLGVYSEEGEGTYPFFFQAFDGQTGLLLPSVEFAYDPVTRTLSQPSAALGIGINKTGWLISLDMYDAVFTPAAVQGVALSVADVSPSAPCYDLQGRRVGAPHAKGIYIAGGRKFVVR